MADQVFNIAKGRVAELYNRVQSNDPAASTLTIVVINRGAATDDTIRGYDTLAAVLGDAAISEVTNTNYARINLTDADLSAIAADDANDRMDLDIPDQTWNQVAAGDSWTDLLVCYNPDGGVADATIIPLTHHDFAVTPDGSDITAVINAAGFFRAT